MKVKNTIPKIDENHPLSLALNSAFPWQREAIFTDARYCALMAHRGAGKTFVISVTAALYALTLQPKPLDPVNPYHYIAILGMQKSQILELYAEKLLRLLDGFVASYQLTASQAGNFIKLINGNTILLDGLTEIKGSKILGQSISLCCIDEIGVIDFHTLAQALLPTLTRYSVNGSLLVAGTPREKTSSFFRVWNEFMPTVGGQKIFVPLTSPLSPFTEDQKKTAELTSSPSVFKQEYLLEWGAADEKSVYMMDIKAIKDEERVLPDDQLSFTAPTFVAMDLGFNDDTVLVMYQVDVDGTPIVVDYYKANRQPLESYIDWILDKNALTEIKMVYLPHDANAQVLGRQFTTHQVFCRELNPAGIRVGILKKATKVAYEIPIVKQVLKKTRFLEKTLPLLDELEGYAYALSADETHYTDVPEPRQDDHVADAIRYFAMSYNAKYADLSADTAESYANRGLISSEYHQTREAMIAEVLRQNNRTQPETLRRRDPIRIMRR